MFMPRRTRKSSVSRAGTSSCVAEIMGTDLFTVTPDTAVAAALRLAASKRITHFLVIDEGNLTGIVCQSDLQLARKETLVSQCMTTPVLCISPETTIEEAAGIMQENAVGCLPVVTGTFLVGMVTRQEVKTVEDDSGSGEDELSVILEETPKAPSEKLDACSCCGKRRKLHADLRYSRAWLCRACAKAMPEPEPTARGN